MRTLQPLKTGETIRVHKEGERRQAKVIEKSDMPRSYVVKTSEGGVYRRNPRRHLPKDALQDQFSQHTDVWMNTEVEQPIRDEQDGNLGEQQ